MTASQPEDFMADELIIPHACCRLGYSLASKTFLYIFNIDVTSSRVLCAQG